MWSERLYEYLGQLGLKIKNKALYEQALTHSSFAHEKGRPDFHNERLEFLGDAVLELIISSYLYSTCPNLQEGKLTKLRSDLVCEASLAKIAGNLKLGRYLLLGKGEHSGGGARRPSLLADGVEALIGALFLDLGLEQCRRHVLDFYKPVFLELQEGALRKDYKTLVQELSQAKFGITPEYKIVDESGPDHLKIFQAEILLDERSIGRGMGRSKKESEQAAAKEAWALLNEGKNSLD